MCTHVDAHVCSCVYMCMHVHEHMEIRIKTQEPLNHPGPLLEGMPHWDRLTGCQAPEICLDLFPSTEITIKQECLLLLLLPWIVEIELWVHIHAKRTLDLWPSELSPQPLGDLFLMKISLLLTTCDKWLVWHRIEYVILFTYLFLFFLTLAVLGIEPRASSVRGNCYHRATVSSLILLILILNVVWFWLPCSLGSCPWPQDFRKVPLARGRSEGSLLSGSRAWPLHGQLLKERNSPWLLTQCSLHC